MWWRRERERELQRELESHLELEAEERSGDLHAARRATGNLTRIGEDARETWGWVAAEHVLRDLHMGFRMLRRRPIFSAIAVVSLAIGIGANTAIFSFAEAILLRKLPVPGADRLVALRQHNEAFGIENCCFRYDVFQELRLRDGDFEDLLALSPIQVILEDDRSDKELLNAEFVSGNYFRMLGVTAAAGRILDESDDGAEGTGAVAVISHRLWLRRFGGRADVVGRRVSINAEPFQIVGVTQPGFTGSSLYTPRDIQIPPSMMRKVQGVFRDGPSTWAMVIGRLKPGVGLEQATAKLNAIGKAIEREAGQIITDRDDFILRDARQGETFVQEQFARPVTLLLALVGAVLLVACANLTALLLVRSVEGAREAGMRVALGASKPALLQRSFAESLTLSAIGGLAGWGVAIGLMRTLSDMLRPQSPGLVEGVTPNLAIFGFSAGLALLTAILFGALPAWRAMRADPLRSIRGATARASLSPLLSRSIIAGQVALSLTLLFCAGLFGRTLANLRSLDLGFRADNLVVLDPDLSSYTRPQQGQFFAELELRARALPNVRSASTSTVSVLSGTLNATTVNVPGYVPPAGVRPTTRTNSVGAEYFRTLGIAVLAGREFTAEDRTGDLTPVVVNEEFARQYMAGDALGKTFAQGAGRGFVVIGVVGTSNYRQMREEPQPTMYLPLSPPFAPAVLHVRTSGDPSRMVERLRALAASIDPRLRFDRIGTMEAQIDGLLARERLLAFLSMFLGGVAVALSAIGLYGVLAFSVVRRTREVGIRVAVGARRASIAAMFLTEGAWTVVAGVVVGVPLALGCGRLASSLLYGLEAQDPATAFGAAGFLLAVAAAAALIPAWRAARVDPMTALRHE